MRSSLVCPSRRCPPQHPPRPRCRGRAPATIACRRRPGRARPQSAGLISLRRAGAGSTQRACSRERPQPPGRPWLGRCRSGGLAVAALAVVGLVLAAVPGQAATVHVVALAGSLDQVLTNLRNWIMGILALVATVFLTIGGTRYVISGGDAGEVSKAKDCFKNAALGYALAALAPLVVQILRGIVGA